MIKILFFIEELHAGGAEKVLCNLVNSMDQSQFEITVQTLWLSDASKYFHPGIRYQSCYSAKTKINRFIYRLEAALGLTYRLHIKDAYDVECAYLECAPTKIIASSTNKRAKKIAWVHCDLQQKMKQMKKPIQFVEHSTHWYTQYDTIVCVSQNVKDSFDELFDYVFDSHVLYNTVDDAEILEKSRVNLSELQNKRRFTVVTVGRLTEQKGYDRLLRIHKNLMAAGNEYDLWILGDGPDRAALEHYVEEQGLSESVKFYGYQSNPYPFLQAADLLVCSSRYEGFSTFVTEGLILGKPIVTTDCTGMRELLGNSRYGLITDNTEPALQAGLQTMIQDPDLRERYADMAKQRGTDFTARSL